MTKSDLLSALERIPGDPEIEVVFTTNQGRKKRGEIDRISEFPRPEIVVIEK